MKTACRPQKSGQMEPYNGTIMARLPLFVDKAPARLRLPMQPLTYTCNAETHCATRLSPIYSDIAAEPPSIATLDRMTGILTDQSADTLSRSLKRELLHCLSGMKKTIIRWLVGVEQWCKENYDRTVQKQLKLIADDPSFVTQITLAAPVDNNAEAVTRHKYEKLMRRATGLCKVLKVRENTTVVDQDGIPINVSIDRVNPVIGRSDEATNGWNECMEVKIESDSEKRQWKTDWTGRPKGRLNAMYGST